MDNIYIVPVYNPRLFYSALYSSLCFVFASVVFVFIAMLFIFVTMIFVFLWALNVYLYTFFVFLSLLVRILFALPVFCIFLSFLSDCMQVLMFISLLFLYLYAFCVSLCFFCISMLLVSLCFLCISMLFLYLGFFCISMLFVCFYALCVSLCPLQILWSLFFSMFFVHLYGPLLIFLPFVCL